MATTDLPADLTDLARLVVSLPWWRWMPGMLTTRGATMVNAWGDGHTVYSRGKARQWTDHTLAKALPDLSSPATLGCLRALVSERVGGPVSAMHWGHGECDAHAITVLGVAPCGGPTEAHALVALGMGVTHAD